ncbi:MAG: hypothetical protein GC200_04790 [Tepidisphaera sp.]|nr:hypothetical protein [Tepidisphaera sp.]
MNTPARHSGSARLPRVLAIGAAGLILLAGGCASHPGTGQSQSQSARPQDQSPRAQLEALALEQNTSPDTRAQAAPPPAGLDLSLLAPLDAASLAPGQPATRSLDDVLDQLAPTTSGVQPPSRQPSSDHPADPAALREYIAGRTALLSGKAAEAISHLETASKLDPASGSIWRELGEAQALAGRRASAAASYRKALQAGDREARVLRALGREAWRAEQADQAAALLAESLRADSDDGNPIWPPAGVDLGQALAKLGYLRASAEVLEASLADPPTQIAQSRDRLELGEVLRRRAELWTLAGDTWARLGQTDKATHAWEEAFNAPGSDTLGLLSRRVYSQMRQGHSALAALSTLDLLANPNGVIDERLLPLLREIGANSSLGEVWPRAVASLGGTQATPSNRARLARAAAASTPDQAAARAVLIDALRQSPFDTSLLDALMPLRDASDVDGRISDLEQIITSEPLAADLAARALIFDGRHIDDAVARLRRDDSGPGRLLAAAALQKLGLPDQGLAILNQSPFDPPFLPAAMAQRAELGAELARPDETTAAIAALQPLAPSSPGARRALALALESAQRAPEALAALSPDLGEHADCTVLLQGADLASQARDQKQAQDLLQRAIAADKFDERAYAPLLELLTRGPNADQQASALVRRLRENIPDSRLIRLLQGRELASRSLWEQSQTLLLGLMSENSEDTDALGLLASVWERARSASPALTSRGLEWLEARLAKRPDSPPLIAATARVRAAAGQAPQAETLLADTLSRWPITDLARLRETIVRSSLNQPDRADDLAKARLQAAPPTPDNAFELAQLLLRTHDTSAAIAALRRAFPAGAGVNLDNASRLGALLAGLTPDDLSKAGAASAEDAVALLDIVASHGVPMTPRLHAARLAMLVVAAPTDFKRLADAADAMEKSIPGTRVNAYSAVIGQLEALDSPAPALAFLREASTRLAPKNSDFLFELFRFTCVKGTREDSIALARDTQEPRALLDALAERMGELVNSDDVDRNPRAELAYLLGSQLSVLNREADAEALYRYALSIDPDQAWAANNLGYMLLEQGRSLDEAEKLIEQAWKRLSSEASVTDSLAWLRYKQGEMTDQRGPTGSLTREGALTLLDRAVNKLNGDTDYAILDHYGDTLFRAGKAADARKAWTQARSLIDSRLEPLANLPAQQQDSPLLARERDALKSITSKLDAMDAGQRPQIAPTFSEVPPAKP